MSNPTPKFKEILTETLDVKEMAGKYLASSVLKKWTQDYLDPDTGEITSVERAEVLFQKGLYLTPNEVSKIQFSIESGEITEPVRLTNLSYKSECYKYAGYRPMMVQVSTGLTKIWLLLWSDTFEHGMQVASEYLEQLITTDFSIIAVKNLGAVLVDRKEFYDKQQEEAEKLDISLNPLRWYTIDAMWKESGTPYPFVRPCKEAREHLRSETFICMAESLDEAKEIVAPEISRYAMELDHWKSIEIHWEKGKPFSPSIIVPKAFCNEYRDYFKDNI